MRTWFERLRQALRTPRPERRPRHRPSLECLEGRCLMATAFVETNLVSDIPGLAPVTDPHLVNPWGVAVSPTPGAFWISDAGSGVATVYTGDVPGSSLTASPLVVTIPPAPGRTQGAPSGQVFNGTADFVVRSGGSSGPALFLFAGLDGTISGWNPNVPAGAGTSTQAQLTVTTPGAVYTGLALAGTAAGNFLYAADSKNGRIAVFDKNFAAATLAGAFTDTNLPAGFTPFNIQNLNGTLFVAFHDSMDRNHGGVVDAFDTSGRFLRRIAAGGPLNAPWGLTLAPAQFGSFGNALLVGNFGDGHISAFDPNTGAFLGQLSGQDGQPLAFERIWRLTFGNGGNAGDSNTLYFSAGINNEKDGLFGSLRVATPEQRFVAQAYLDLLQRPVDNGGLTFWTDQLARGTSRARVVQAIEGSAEYRAVVVQSLYHTFLHRGTDPGGLQTFTNMLAAGGTTEQVEAMLAGSPEYLQNRGGGTTDGFLNALYQDAFARAVDGGGRTTFDRALMMGTSRAQVAAAVLASGEFHQDLVQSFYPRFLRRAADSGGVTTFTAALDRGARDEQVILEIVASDEYFARL